MKKVLLLAVAGVFVLGMSSCKKDYTCTCDVSGQKYTYELKDVKKKDAKNACDQVGSSWIIIGGTCDFK